MRKLLVILVPLTLFAQVEIDTVIRLPTTNLGQAWFIPELNKLYVKGSGQYFVLDCSTYQVKAQIPRPYSMGRAHYSWNWRRQKLYINNNPRPDSTLVIDAAADSVIGWLSVRRETHLPQVYASDVDLLYMSEGDTLYAFDCAADTVARRIKHPEYAISQVSWDSVGRKLFLGGGKIGQPILAVYDYLTDSFTKVIDVSSVNLSGINALVFNYAHRKAYFGPSGPEPWGQDVGILDLEHDTLLSGLPVTIWDGICNQVVVNERDGKVYLADNNTDPDTPDTLWVVDCATDSVLKKVEYEPRGIGPKSIRWVPWSNRIYLSCNDFSNSSIVVLDCNTDSIVVPGLHLGSQCAMDIQLDPIRERIFVIRADSNTIHVLRDVEGGVAEEPASTRLALVSGLQVQTAPGGFELRYSVPSPCRVDLSVYDLMGREVRRLVAEEQPAGEHRANWDCRDTNGALVPRGVYFCRLAAGSASTAEPTAVAKVVVTR